MEKKKFPYELLQVPLSPSQKKLIKSECKKRGISMSSIVKIALKRELNLENFESELAK